MVHIWTDKQRKIVGVIIGLAIDKRHRILLTDENEWLKRKLKEIAKLSKELPNIKWDGTEV